MLLLCDLQIQWADACLIVYSITDRISYEYAVKSISELKSLQNMPSAYLVANKADLDHLRVVSSILFVLILKANINNIMH